MLAVVATVILAARQLRPLVAAGAFLARTGETVTAVPVTAWPRAAIWVGVSIAVVVRRRVAAALGAWAAAAYEVALVAVHAGDPSRDDALHLLVWPVLLAVAAALLLTVPAPAGRGLALLGRRGRWLLAAAAIVTALSAAAIPLLGEYYGPAPADPIDPGFHVVFAVPSPLAGAVAGLTFVVVLLLAAAAVLGVVDRGVHNRVLTLAAAGTAAFVAMQLGMPRPFGVWSAPLLSGPAEAVLLAVTPVIVLAAGLVVIRLREHPPPPAAS